MATSHPSKPSRPVKRVIPIVSDETVFEKVSKDRRFEQNALADMFAGKIAPYKFDQFWTEYKIWVDHNFDRSDHASELGKRKATEQFLGVVEEVGELSHAILKQVQGIRGTDEEHDAKQRDAVADIVIFLAGFCYRKGWNLEELILEVWKEVRQRDWKTYPGKGRP